MNNTGPVKADMLRLNTSIAPCTADAADDNDGMCRALGVFPTDPAAEADDYAADLAAFPNGRRLGDDVTDIEIRAVAQGYGPILNSLFGLPNLAPNNIVGDGLGSNADMPFADELPVHRPAARRVRACPPRGDAPELTPSIPHNSGPVAFGGRAFCYCAARRRSRPSRMRSSPNANSKSSSQAPRTPSWLTDVASSAMRG